MYVLRTEGVTLLLFMFGLDPKSGKLAIYDESKKNTRQAPPDVRDTIPDYKMYEEPKISEQQQEVINNMIERRT